MHFHSIDRSLVVLMSQENESVYPSYAMLLQLYIETVIAILYLGNTVWIVIMNLPVRFKIA